DMINALEFMGRVLPHRSIAVVISDFQTPQSSGALPLPIQTALRIANRRHDVVTVQITDRYEMQLPALGRLTLEDAETGEILEINTSDPGSRDAFALRRQKQLNDLARQFRSSGIDSIQLRTDEPYGAALGNFFETRERRRMRG
ncbi:MAG TPA: hypothetical protein VK811_07335, partial [Candidatus Acidoferrum sp.]|nr:hypothetical protein [Candidatus Acidoferrum sp.]